MAPVACPFHYLGENAEFTLDFFFCKQIDPIIHTLVTKISHLSKGLLLQMTIPSTFVYIYFTFVIVFIFPQCSVNKRDLLA